MGIQYFVRKNHFEGEILVNSTTVYYDEDPRACLRYIQEQSEPHLYKMDSPYTRKLKEEKK